VVRHISDRVAVMYLGRIVELSVCDDLYEAPLHPYTQALLSAIPVPKPGRRTDRVILQGDVPNPSSPPSGCHFHPRCPLAFDRCRIEAPKMLDVRPGHRVRCHLYEDVAFPAEPIPIGSAPRRPPAPAAGSQDSIETVDFDESLEFGMFEGSVNGDSDRPVGIPEVLADRDGMLLGPFGEIIDPEDSFVKTAEIPSLDVLVDRPTVSVADEPAPLPRPGTMGPDDSVDSSLDEDAETHTSMQAVGDASLAAHGDDTDATLSDLDDEATILARPPLPAADERERAPLQIETTLERPADRDSDSDLDLEDTVDAPIPIEAETTGSVPPIHVEEGEEDEASGVEGDPVPADPADPSDDP
jgi:oligopeptide/dipeptide ABC transporter ATP-binding protein